MGLVAAGLVFILLRIAQRRSNHPGGQRIVSLDYGLASTLLSLGVQPVGISDLADWNKWVVEPEMPSSVVDIGSSHEVDLEVLIQLKPDIILTTPYLDQLLPRLQPIAKILRLEIFTPDGGPVLPAAISATRKLGSGLGREMEAEQFLTRSDAFFETCRARLAGRALPPVALGSFMDARHARIYSAPGLFHNALERISERRGIELAEERCSLTGSVWSDISPFLDYGWDNLPATLRREGYWAWFPATCLLLGIVMIFVGVIARGFERVEKAIIHKRLGGFCR